MFDEEFEHVDGCTGPGAKESDLILGSIIDAVDVAAPADDVIITINQYSLCGGKLRAFCTGVNSMCTILSYWNDEKDEQRRSDYFDYAVEHRGYKEGYGNSSNTGNDCAVTYWNLNDPRKMVKSRTTYGSEQYKIAYGKLLGIGVSYRGNKAYNDDFKKDNVLHGVEFGPSTYGHYTAKYKDDIHDSAKGRPYNVYEIKSDINKLIENKVFYLAMYIIVPDPTSKSLEAEKEFRDAYQYAKDDGITNIDFDDRENDKDKEVRVMFGRMKKDIDEKIENIESILGKILEKLNSGQGDTPGSV